MFISILQLVTGVLNIGLGFFVFSKNKSRLTNQSFALFAVASGLLNLAIYIVLHSQSMAMQEFWAKVGLSCGSLFMGGLLIFAMSFPWPDRNLFRKSAVLIALTSLFALLPLWIVKSVQAHEGFITGVFSNVQWLWLFYIGTCLVYSIFLLIRKYFKARDIQRLQVQYIIMGLLLFIVPIFLTNVILPNIYGVFRYNNLGPIFTIPMILFVAYAIARHQLMDIQLIIQRGLVYIISLFGVSGIYFGIILLLGNFVRKTTNSTYLVGGLITAVLGAIVYPYFKTYFERSTENIFFKGGYNYFSTLKVLSLALSSTLDLTELYHKVSSILKESLKVETVLLLLKKSGGSFEVFDGADKAKHAAMIDLSQLFLSLTREMLVCQEIQNLLSRGDLRHHSYEKLCLMAGKLGIGILIPITIKEEVIAVMMIGNKRSQDAFVQKDIELLSIFSHQAGVTFKNAQLYEEIRRSNLELEDRIEQRTQELQHLYQAQTRFMADISHELQTPLAIMKGNTELLTDGDAKVVETIQETLGSMSRLVNNLLAIARFEFGYTFKIETVCLNQLLHRVVEDFGTLAKDKRIDFKLEVKDKEAVYCFPGDREKIKELFLNLISNALKYTPEGGSITIYLERENETVVARVVDTGIGINPEEIPHIFERFYRGPKTGGTRGIGLGLAICKQIVEAHHGSIQVQSTEGHGTQFTVTFPLLSQ